MSSQHSGSSSSSSNFTDVSTGQGDIARAKLALPNKTRIKLPPLPNRRPMQNLDYFRFDSMNTDEPEQPPLPPRKLRLSQIHKKSKFKGSVNHEVSIDSQTYSVTSSVDSEKTQHNKNTSITSGLEDMYFAIFPDSFNNNGGKESDNNFKDKTTNRELPPVISENGLKKSQSEKNKEMESLECSRTENHEDGGNPPPALPSRHKSTKKTKTLFINIFNDNPTIPSFTNRHRSSISPAGQNKPLPNLPPRHEYNFISRFDTWVETRHPSMRQYKKAVYVALVFFIIGIILIIIFAAIGKFSSHNTLAEVNGGSDVGRSGLLLNGIGHGTYYDPAVGTGACGFLNTDKELVAALNAPQFGAFSNPADSPVCGACIRVTGPKGTVKVKIMDKCPVCRNGDVDMSSTAFNKIADEAQGRVNITWTGC